jgi:hypothetical protein
MIISHVNGVECVFFYDERLTPAQAPPGYPYMYHLRHDENNWVRPISIEKCVWVNFFGTVFMKNPLDFGDYCWIDVKKFKMGKNNFFGFRIKPEYFRQVFGVENPE